MSQERTEKATPKRRRKAREEGQVVKSRELTSALSLLLILLFLLFMVPLGWRFFQTFLINSLSGDLLMNVTVENVHGIALEGVTVLAILALPVLGFAALIGFSGEIAQVGFLFTAKLISPKLSKLNPLKGFQRIFSKRTLVELVKSLLKAGLFSFIAYSLLKGSFPEILKLSQYPLEEAVSFTGSLIVRIGITMAVFQLVIGGLDYAYQWWEHEKNMRMTKKEILDEHKETEGDPYIQGRIKERRRFLAQQRMMQAVPDASVVITNPTRLAIALEYDSEKSFAPLIVAKGQGDIAHKIIALAKEHGVHIVEDKPLAQTLFQVGEVGSEIPVDLYQAVAEILAFVYRLQKVYS